MCVFGRYFVIKPSYVMAQMLTCIDSPAWVLNVPEPCYVLVGCLEIVALVACMGRQMRHVEEQGLMPGMAFDKLHGFVSEQIGAVTPFRVPIHGHIATHIIAFPRLSLKTKHNYIYLQRTTINKHIVLIVIYLLILLGTLVGA